MITNKTHEIPQGIKLISFATSVRYFGWGLCESFIPALFIIYSSSYFEAGLLDSIYRIFFILSLPIIGLVADKIKSRTLIIAGLIIYPFVGLSYVLTGLTGFIIFLFLARCFNGVSYAFDLIGRETYFMHHANKNEESRTFGYFDFVSNIGWMLGALISLILIQFLDIHLLFIGIIPTSIIAIFFILKLKENSNNKCKIVFRELFKENYSIKNLTTFPSRNKGIKLITLLNFTTSFLDQFVFVFMPVYAYINGVSLAKTALFYIIYSIPSLFGNFFGKLADDHKENTLLIGSLLMVLVFFLLAFTNNFIAQLILTFLFGALLELIGVASDGITARMADPNKYGEINSRIAIIGSFGSLAGPIITGILIDVITIQKTFLFVSFLTLVVTSILFKEKKSLRNKEFTSN